MDEPVHSMEKSSVPAELFLFSQDPLRMLVSDICDLCGLTLRYGHHTLISAGQSYSFCCIGCQQVFSMLITVMRFSHTLAMISGVGFMCPSHF